VPLPLGVLLQTTPHPRSRLASARPAQCQQLMLAVLLAWLVPVTTDSSGRARGNYGRAARPGCNGARRKPRALSESTGAQPRPTTRGPTETPTTDAHACAIGPPISLLPPGPAHHPQSSNYELVRPGCDQRGLSSPNTMQHPHITRWRPLTRRGASHEPTRTKT
jgi:hypothetical protein